MTGSEVTAQVNGWWRHDNGRWVIEDAGRQPEIAPVPAQGNAGTRPDTLVDGGTIGGLTYRATSQRGFGHQQLGTPRQDAYLVRPTPDRRWLVGCVADGVSEGKQSHEAADLVCAETTLGLARALSAGCELNELPWTDVAEAANAAVRRAAREAVARSGTPLADESFDDARARRVMSTTAVVFVVSTAAGADGFPYAVAVVAGDSAALLLDDGEWTPLSAVKNEGAEVASSAVNPLPRPVEVRPEARVLRPGQALVVITDGVGDPLGSGSGVVGRFLASMWATPPEILAYAQHVGFYRKSFTDDRTAVTVWAGRP